LAINDFRLKRGGKVLVVGLGKSGLAAAGWLARQGAQITVSETRDASAFDRRLLEELSMNGIEIEFGGHRLESFVDADLIVVSPGVPLDIMPLVEASKRGVPVVGELEMAWTYLRTPSIAVTGTNGKSTAVKLIGEMLSRAGRTAFVGGNIGLPLTDYISGTQDADYVVLEVSSFQLDTIAGFSPLVSVILNISPDHLDRYADYGAYTRSKQRIFENQGPGQTLILNDDDPVLGGLEITGGAQVYRYGVKREAGRQCFIEDGRVAAEMPGQGRFSFELDRCALPGIHNHANVMAAILAALAVETPADAVQEAIDRFQGLPHRIELVDKLRGVAFYDDSKATNIDAAIKSITSFSGPVVLIAGGRHKGSDYLPLVRAAEGRVRKAVFMGESSALLAEAFNGKISWSQAGSMDDAVGMAYECAREGDVVLLAPACSSFDMFRDFEQRGMAFQEAVRGLRDGSKRGRAL
jgi:UDP-N-acetylmuramoylalanine--D-glutamate ligase